MNSFITTRYNYPLTKSGYVCSVFTCNFKPDKNNYETYFSYVYWPITQKTKKFIPEYVCLSPTYNSRDGEYRDNFIEWDAFERGYELFIDLLSKSEEIINALVELEIISIDVTVYPIDKKDQILDEIDDQRLLIRLLSVALIMDGYKFKNNIMQIHTNGVYFKFIEFVYNSTILNDVVKSIDYELYQNLRIFHTGKEHKFYRPRCGQKITPLTLRESTQPGDITHKIWKEIDANVYTTDLVLNFISPCFSIYNNWTYIEDCDRGFFEGESMRNKYLNGIKAKLTIDSLKEARKKIPISKDGMPINYNFGKLSGRIYDAIEYGESLLLMSDITLVSLNEYTGYTFASLPQFIRGVEDIEPAVENIFSNIRLFVRHI